MVRLPATSPDHHRTQNILPITEYDVTCSIHASTQISIEQYRKIIQGQNNNCCNSQVFNISSDYILKFLYKINEEKITF